MTVRTILAVVVDAREETPRVGVSTHDADALLARAVDVLSAFEIEKCARVMLAPARTLRTAAHVLKRDALANALGLAARAVAFVEPSDRPLLISPHDVLHVSLSHARDAVAIAFGFTPIGVDIEAMDRSNDSRALARRFFGPGEAEAVERAATGFEFAWRWTAKEALKKAADIDLFDALTRPMPLDIDPRNCFTVHGARFDVLEPAPGYACSVARLPIRA